MACNDALRPFRVALLSADGLASLACAIAWPSDAQADIDGKTLANSGQLPSPSGQFIMLHAATGVVLLPLKPGLLDAARSRTNRRTPRRVRHARESNPCVCLS